MKKYLLVSVLAVSACTNIPLSGGGSGGGQRQKIEPTPPVNLPLAGYARNEFTDVRGCNYVRTEYEGNVTWVPRVTLGGSHICGGAEATRFAVAPGIDDPHGTLTAQKPTQVAPPLQVASLPAPTVATAVASLPQTSVITPAPTPTVAPEPVAEVPAPAAEPAPAPTVAPEQVSVPSATPLPARGSGNKMVVFVGTARTPASPALINQLKAEGYRVVERNEFGRKSVFVLPNEGENPLALRQKIIGMGANYALVAGVKF